MTQQKKRPGAAATASEPMSNVRTPRKDRDMNCKGNSTAAVIVPALAMQANAVAKTKIKSVQNVADVLARMMEDLHGGSWRAFVEHGANAEFVLVRPNNEKAIAKPRRGEAA